MMVVRAANGCAIFRLGASPLPSALCSCFRTAHFTLGLRFPPYSARICSAHSLVDRVLDEFKSTHKRFNRKPDCTASKVGLTSHGELLKIKPENQVLKEGLLLEYKKDFERILAVVQRSDGKNNWMVSDQVQVETTNAAC